MKLFNLSRDFAVDLGTANTLIMHEDKIVVNEPSIVAFDVFKNKVIAVGFEAMNMHEKTHQNIKTVKPLRDGVIADYHAAEEMIKGMLSKALIKQGFGIGAKRFVICIPYATTEVEKRAVRDSAQHVGATEVYMIHEPIAAALGIGLDITAPTGWMVVDIGGGTTEIVVISLSGVVCNQSVKIAGNAFDLDIIDYMRRQHNLMIGERTAEKIKVEVGSAVHDLDNPPQPYRVLGRDLITGIPKAINIGHEEIATVLDKNVSKIEEAVLKALEECPPELSADIYENGIYLTGGGAYLRGLDKRLSKATQLKINIAAEPLLAVMRGTGKALKDLPKFREVLMR